MHQNKNSQHLVLTDKYGNIRYYVVRKKVTRLALTVAPKSVNATYSKYVQKNFTCTLLVATEAIKIVYPT